MSSSFSIPNDNIIVLFCADMRDFGDTMKVRSTLHMFFSSNQIVFSACRIQTFAIHPSRRKQFFYIPLFVWGKFLETLFSPHNWVYWAEQVAILLSRGILLHALDGLSNFLMRFLAECVDCLFSLPFLCGPHFCIYRHEAHAIFDKSLPAGHAACFFHSFHFALSSINALFPQVAYFKSKKARSNIVHHFR